MPGCPPIELRQLVQEHIVVETRILDVPQERDHLRIRPDRVGDIQQRQPPHLRRHVVRNRLCQNVGRVLFAQPLGDPIVQPIGGVHPGHDQLKTSRIEQHPPELADIVPDEVDQLRPGLGFDVAFQDLEGGLALRDQSGDDRRIRRDRIRSADHRCSDGILVRTLPDETTVHGGLQCVPPDERIGRAQRCHQGRAGRR